MFFNISIFINLVINLVLFSLLSSRLINVLFFKNNISFVYIFINLNISFIIVISKYKLYVNGVIFNFS